MEASSASAQTPYLRVLEFYSGIGGLHYSLLEAGVAAQVVESFDINEVANDVYQHNFGRRPNQGNIQRLSVQQLQDYEADAWLLSPPCQPYTRQGLKKDVDDGRALSFLQMLTSLPMMDRPPSYLAVENVVGFENSVTHTRLLEALAVCRYTVQEFVLSPVQFSVPYSRPRYFCLARLQRHFAHGSLEGRILSHPLPLLHAHSASEGGCYVCKTLQFETESPDFAAFALEALEGGNESWNVGEGGEGETERKIGSGIVREETPSKDGGVACRAIQDFLLAEPEIGGSRNCPLFADLRSAEGGMVEKNGSGNGHALAQGSLENGGISMEEDAGLRGNSCCLGLDLQQQDADSQQTADDDTWQPFRVPASVYERWGEAMDIVTERSKRCCCFTKSYVKYAKGTGSVLATKVDDIVDTERHQTVEGWRQRAATREECNAKEGEVEWCGVPLRNLGLRYFTPREVANLHSFPSDFSFPDHVSLRQRYALLGNSLSVAVVGPLLRYLLTS